MIHNFYFCLQKLSIFIEINDLNLNIVLCFQLNNTFPEPEFEEGVRTYRQEWLPQIPVTSEEVFQQMSVSFL